MNGIRRNKRLRSKENKNKLEFNRRNRLKSNSTMKLEGKLIRILVNKRSKMSLLLKMD